MADLAQICAGDMCAAGAREDRLHRQIGIGRHDTQRGERIVACWMSVNLVRGVDDAACVFQSASSG